MSENPIEFDSLEDEMRGYSLMKQEPPEVEGYDSVWYFKQPIASRIRIFLQSYYGDDSDWTLQQKWNHFTSTNYGT